MTPVEAVTYRDGASNGALDAHARGLRGTAASLAGLLCMDAAGFAAAVLTSSATAGVWAPGHEPLPGYAALLTDWDAVRRDLHDRAGLPGRWG